MELNKALSQIEEIHGHLARTEVYRGYRSLPVAVTGVLAIAAGFFQPYFVSNQTAMNFVTFWIGLAVVSLLIIGSEIGYNYFAHSGSVGRRASRRAIGQFLPSLVAGLIVTIGIAAFDETHIKLLPGLWAILFGLGIFSSRPYLPRATGWIALFYLVAGGALLANRGNGFPSLSLAMGATFGAGQLLSAAVLYWNLERNDNA